MEKTVVFSLLIIGSHVLFAQQIPEKGVPWIDNYTAAQYKNHGKIWEITSAKNGIVYMAGNAGLLEYDGQTWNQFKGSKGYMRSLLVMNDSLLYSGSDLDFGVWHRNASNRFVYTSLYPFKEDVNEENEEFWDVYRIKDVIVFTSFSNIYLYKNKQLTKIAAPGRLSGSFQGKDKVYLADDTNGLYVFNGVTIKLLFKYPNKSPLKISGVFETQDGLTIATKSNGLFLYTSNTLSPIKSPISDYLKRDQVFCATRINNYYYAFATILNGLYVTDPEGNIIQHINKKKGLQNNTILSIHYTPNGRLWLGMDYGISSIHLFDNTTYFFDYQGVFGTAQSALLQNNQFYLGTNQGLYKTEWQNLNNNNISNELFSLVPGTEGQVWSLAKINGTVLCGHDKGLFRIAGNSVHQIHPEPGVWTILIYQDKYMLTGNYNGISVFELDGNNFRFIKKIELILGSCNQLIHEKDNIIWVNIPNYGLIRLEVNEDFYPVRRTIFPTSLFDGNALDLLKDQNGVWVLTSEYRYLFEPQRKKFIRRGANVYPKNIEGLPDGIYRPYQIDNNYQFYPLYNGFALCLPALKFQPSKIEDLILFREIVVFNNQTRAIYPRGAPIHYTLNNLRLNYIVPHKKNIYYQYKLEPFSETWSAWSTNTSVDFLNLKEGSYTFRIRGKVENGYRMNSTFNFTILPPWYRTKIAYLSYLALAALLYFLIRERQNFKLREQKKALLKREQIALQQQAEKHEQKTLLYKQQQLEQEKITLRHQIKQKSIELAKQAKENESKNRLLHLLKEKIDALQHDPTVNRGRWTEIKRLLDLYLETEDKTFEIQIDELHQELFEKLREKFPDLSLYDLRLCAYLKIGLNSKEISEILKVLPSSINVSRSRLRKKLNLRHDQDLYRYLNQIR